MKKSPSKRNGFTDKQKRPLRRLGKYLKPHAAMHRLLPGTVDNIMVRSTAGAMVMAAAYLGAVLHRPGASAHSKVLLCCRVQRTATTEES